MSPKMANETTSKRGRKAKAEKPAEKVDFKTQLWNAADAMRGNLDAAVYNGKSRPQTRYNDGRATASG